MICVFGPTATDFTTLGLGALAPSSCTVTETLNGEWELTLIHPLDENGKWTRLQYGNIIKAPVPAAPTPRVRMISQADGRIIYRVSTQVDPLNLRSGPGTSYSWIATYRKGTEVVLVSKTNDDWYEVICPDGRRGYMSTQYLTYVRTEDTTAIATGHVIEPRQLREQPFRVYRVVPELDKVTAYARHLFYDLMDNMIVSYKPSAGVSGVNVVNGIFTHTQSPHPFTVYTDLTGTADGIAFENVNPVEALLGENGVTENFTGELARDWYDVYLVKRVGTDSDVHIRQAKNLLGVSYDVDETNVATRILPTGETKDGELLYLDELYLDSPYIGSYPHPKWMRLHVSEAKVSEDMSVAQAKAKLREAALEILEGGCDLPTVTVQVDFVNIADTREYAAYRPISDIFLGDSVRVTVPDLGLELSLRMTQYTYDCLLKRYTVCKLGAIADSVENSLVSARQLASGSITGSKLAIASVGSGQLQHASVGSLQVKTAAIGAAHIQDAAIQTAHIENASITQAKIANALMDTLTVNALTAVSAKIMELSTGEITTDELYAAIASIAYAQLTTANILRADIRWAEIGTLAAEVAQIAEASINTASIREADIDWAAITGLTAAVAAIVNASVETADIDWAHIKDLATDTAIITQGVGGELFIAKLAVTEANMVSLTVGELVVKGEDGHFYAVSVGEDGNIVTTLKQIGNGDVQNASIHAGEKLIEGSVTAATLNAGDIFANNAVIRSLIAANLDVDTLFAREATIAALNAADITGNEYLRLMVAEKADAEDVEALGNRVSAAELKITPDAIVSTVTGSQAYRADQELIYEAIENLDDGNGVEASDTAPATPDINTLWLDTSLTPNVLKRWDGAAWVMIGPELSEYYTKTEMNTRFQQTGEAIALKADQTVTDSLGNRLEEAEASLTTQASSISAQATQISSLNAGLNNLSIGSRNYLMNSRVTVELNSPSQYGNAYPTVPLQMSRDLVRDCVGKQVMASFYYMMENAQRQANGYLYLRFTGTLTNGTPLTTTCQNATTGTKSWTRYTSLITVHAAYAEITSVEFFITGYMGLVRIRDPQIEQGSRVTSYRPALEDMLTVRSDLPPENPYMDMMWLDTSLTPNALKRWDGAAWQTVNDTTALTERISTAELKLTPDAILTSVRASSLYRNEKYGGRNYALESHREIPFSGAYFVNSQGVVTGSTLATLSVSDDFFLHSGSGASMRLSFDIRRENVQGNTSNYYGGVWVYYRYLGADGVSVLTTGRGWYLRVTDADFVATDADWVRIYKGPMSLTAYAPLSIAYCAFGSANVVGASGMTTYRNMKLEVGDEFTDWSAATEDLDGLPNRMTTAESSITQNSTDISLRVLTSTYNSEKVFRGGTAPVSPDLNALWLDTSQSPGLIKRWTGTAWAATGADTLKTSGIFIGQNNVAITTEQFLLQLLDPADNENVLMEMSANGKVGFKELYADNVVSTSVAAAYNGPLILYVLPTYSGSLPQYFRSLSDCVKTLNGKFLKENVVIYLPTSTGTLYESAGVQIFGITGPGRLAIAGYAACPLVGYLSIKGCTAHIYIQNLTLRESRPLLVGGGRNSYLLELQMNHFVELAGCTLDGNGTTQDGCYCRTTHAYLNNCGLYNITQGVEASAGSVVMKNCKGSCTYACISYASFIICSGTVPVGTRAYGDNGQLYTANVTQDSGTAIPPGTPDSTTIQYATVTKSYRDGWRADTLDVVQGVYSDYGYSSSLSWNYGCMWFPNLLTVLQGEELRSATLTLRRKDGNGAFAARTIYLCAITNTSASGVPVISTNFGAIGTIGRNVQSTFAIPIAAVQGLANGNYGGLCLYETPYNFGSSTFSNNYMRFSGSDVAEKPYLLVVYKSSAVG
ncbi:MAG: phage tail spike protein [Candidatus Limiplasma sp.]|nr:phage tail spike protein [Candidatus Limiplasma sp.]